MCPGPILFYTLNELFVEHRNCDNHARTRKPEINAEIRSRQAGRAIQGNDSDMSLVGGSGCLSHHGTNVAPQGKCNCKFSDHGSIHQLEKTSIITGSFATHPSHSTRHISPSDSRQRCPGSAQGVYTSGRPGRRLDAFEELERREIRLRA
jgi:hypothetical protein